MGRWLTKIHVEELIEPRPQQVALAAVSSFLGPHRVLPRVKPAESREAFRVLR